LGWVYGLATDLKGNIFVSGGTNELFKFDPEGTLLWNKNVPGLWGNYKANLLALDGNDNIYLAGYGDPRPYGLAEG
jgi:outer membrane protein assembly factor BamB